VHKGHSRHAPVVAIAATLLIVGAILVSRSGRIAAITAVVGSTTIGLIVLAHIGVLAAIAACLVALRRLLRQDRRK
jgi:cytochrome c biogenesis factor